MKALRLGLALTLFAPAAMAADLALVITNSADFTGRTAARVADSHAALVEALDGNGYEVVQITDGRRAELVTRIAAFEAAMEDAERVVIVYSGDYLSYGGRTWLPPADAKADSRTAALAGAVPLELLLDFAGQRPADSVVALGLSRQVPVPGGRATTAPEFDIPQGVLVIRGGAQRVMDLLSEEMLGEGRTVGEIDPGDARVSLEGLVLPGLALAAPSDAAPAPQVPEATPVEPGDFAEETLWALARNGDNDVAYRLYLQRYPDGKYAAEARAALGLPAPGSVPTPEQAERDLGLSRSVRRQVQADLTVLGFDTRGVDGIFGGGTRSALRAWQGGNDVEVTGFLTAEQLARLNAQADIRREEIRVEDERRAREQRQADEAFWRQTGASGAEEDLRTYLNRYPDGAYAQQARAILSDIDRQREGAADDAAWADASAADTERAYLRYMRRYPEGLHAGEARARIDELRRGTANLDEVEVYRDQERALGLNVASALVIEQRLRALGYQVGPVDGQLDNTTRDAIARFQGEQGLTATGYLNTATVQRLILASSR